MARSNRYGYRQRNMKQKEQLYVEDVMEALRLTSTKYQYYATQCRDGEIRRLCQHIAQHQQSELQQMQSLMNQRSGQIQ